MSIVSEHGTVSCCQQTSSNPLLPADVIKPQRTPTNSETKSADSSVTPRGEYEG